VCADVIGFVHDAVMTPEQRTALHAKVGEVSITGDTARARSSGGGIYWLRMAGGRWLIDEVPLVTSK
jgi:hypothetical protein